MFGCNECQPIIECTNDIDCFRSHGRGYRCEEDCCSRAIRCVSHERDDYGPHENDNRINCQEEGTCDHDPIASPDDNSQPPSDDFDPMQLDNPENGESPHLPNAPENRNLPGDKFAPVGPSDPNRNP